MFHFGRFPSCTYVFSTGFMILHHEGFPIRKSAGRSLFAAHRSLSQLVTSFFGSWCQGIRRMLFLAWPRRHSLHSYLPFGFALFYDLSFSCFYYVSKLLLVSLDTFAFSFKHLCYPFSIWKNLFTNLLFSYSFFCIQFSNNSFKHLCDVWKVNSDKRLFISHSDLIDR